MPQQTIFPSSLPDVIHQYHPHCELNIFSNQNIALDLPGLGNVMDSTHPQFSDTVDINLFRSPCLRAISLWLLLGTTMKIPFVQIKRQ